MLGSGGSIMQQLLMAPNGSSRNGATPSGTTINELAARSFRQNGSSSHSQNGQHNNDGEWLNGEQSFAISNNTPTMHLKCAECGLTKNSSEELEVHIKQEHLNWLPFQCPICLSERASDAQMREHLHSAHRKNMNKFIYVDNVNAKRNLQILMDRSFTHAMSSSNSSSSTTRRGPMMALNGRSNHSLNQVANQLLERKEKEKEILAAAAEVTPARSESPRVSSAGSNSHSRKRDRDSTTNGLSSGSATDALLAQINAATGAASSGNEDDYDDPTETLSLMFSSSKRIKAEYEQDVDDLRLPADDSGDFGSGLGSDPSSMLESLFASAAAAVNSDAMSLMINAGNDEFHMNSKYGGKGTPPITKKRVLGECSKCQKPVTAGARQMHMFYHLGKDHGIFRFRCKFDTCNVEHYRKDQMENHHSKVHGRIDPEMMEDRSLELYQRCQELSRELFVPAGTFKNASEDKDLSMDLLGTNSCTPGPTAEKAQLTYNAQLAAAAAKKQHSEKPTPKRKHDSARDGQDATTWQNKAIPEDEHPLECRKCHKQMQNRIRGFHILWHLAKDLGINRYTCKFCEFGHDRSQSVQTHGKREHGTEDVVLDRIDEFQEEIKEMSEACFGFQALFSQESRRRSKIPLAPRENANDSAANSPTADEDLVLDADEQNSTKEEELDEADSTADVTEEEEEILEDDVDEPEEEEPATKATSSGASRKHRSNRRFGTRKPPSKNKRLEMARLREISMKLGGAQYFKKKLNEAAHCEICGMLQHSRLSEHAYKHLNIQLFLCPLCDLGNYSRETVVKHIKEMHDDDRGSRPVDQRLKFAQEIKDMIAKCYPSFFVDAPIPTVADIDKLRVQLGDGMRDTIADVDSDDSEDENSGDEDEEAGDVDEREM